MLEHIWNFILVTPYGLLAIILLLGGIAVGLCILMMIGWWRQTEKKELAYVLYGVGSAALFVLFSRLIFFPSGIYRAFSFWPGILLTLLCIVLGVGICAAFAILWLFFGRVSDSRISERKE